MANQVRAISQNGGIVVCAMDSTCIVQEMECIHSTSATVSAALGRLLTGASLMGSWLKNTEDSLTLRVNGGGPAGTLLAVCDGNGNVRGYAGNPVVEDAIRTEDGKLDVGAVTGHNGTLSVIRDLGLKEPYIGQVPLVSGEIAEDITSYYATSEQTPTVCALGVLVNKDLSIRKAGGFLLQLLPGATEEEITAIEKNIKVMPTVTELLENGGTVYDMVQLALEGFSPDIMEERDVKYRCHCSMEKVERILISLGREEMKKMQEENDTTTVECHFCDKVYTVKLGDLLTEMG